MGRKRKTDIDLVVEEEVKDELETYEADESDNLKEGMEPETYPLEVGYGIQEDTSEVCYDMNSPGWTDYVMDELLDKKEKKDGNPTTDGLRRVANLVFDNNLSYDLKVHSATPDFAA